MIRPVWGTREGSQRVGLGVGLSRLACRPRSSPCALARLLLRVPGPPPGEGSPPRPSAPPRLGILPSEPPPPPECQGDSKGPTQDFARVAVRHTSLSVQPCPVQLHPDQLSDDRLPPSGPISIGDWLTEPQHRRPHVAHCPSFLCQGPCLGSWTRCGVAFESPGLAVLSPGRDPAGKAVVRTRGISPLRERSSRTSLAAVTRAPALLLSPGVRTSPLSTGPRAYRLSPQEESPGGWHVLGTCMVSGDQASHSLL